MKYLILLFFFVNIIATGCSIAMAGGDPSRGKKVYGRCSFCHMVGANARNRTGPHHNGLIGRAAGSVKGFGYSKLMLNAGTAGLIWNDVNLVEFLKNPSKFLKAFLIKEGHSDQAMGSSKMSFKLTSRQDAKDVIAYINSVSP